ncbi:MULTISPECIES: hypothetical protein [Mesorhizobium]|uniref:Maleate isomerase n=1 Tax=Rhizobium loti TaxID=381 RepID=A0A8E2WAY5_RHILI|nr:MULTISPECIES: hypothetical protein [Mesorhizobium]PWJ88181.1 maleate isomerase [Mesorhizobium loti]QKC86876.1 hypothetical protein EB232_35280 [Mesorhizobium sp. NZP2077]QKD20581.1 hypothetical protein HGP13_37230 [Mesorhizobium sp. NZP2077]
MTELDTQILDRVTKPSKAATVGLIVLNTDEVAGIAFNSIMPKEKVSVFETRCGYNTVNGFSLTRTLAEVANDLPPVDRMDVVAFSCTSGTVAWGLERLFSELSKAFPGAKYTSPASAAILALRRLNASRIALLTPYGLETHKSFLSFFGGTGFEIVANGTFPYSTDHEICELSSESIFGAAKTLTLDGLPDALFISCCATPVVPHIKDLERELGIPVVTSSQAMAWDALHLADCYEPIQGFGRLLTLSR